MTVCLTHVGIIRGGGMCVIVVCVVALVMVGLFLLGIGFHLRGIHRAVWRGWGMTF